MAKSVRLGKTTRWVLTIGILAILLISAGVVYSRQKAEQSELSASIAQAQWELIKYELPPADGKEQLERRLAEADSSITGLQNEFRQYTESIEINEALFEAAADANVTITELTSSLPEEEELNGAIYQVFSIEVTAEGEVVALLNFSDKVSQRFSTSDIQAVGIEVPQEEEEGEEKEPEKASMTLSLKVYVYE